MDAMLAKTSIRNYRPDIDGIRAIAVVSVVLYHAGVPWVRGGFSGVDIFFVLSGYLIGGQIFFEICSGTFSFLRFYQRRAKRILPAFYLVTSFTFLAAMLLLSPFEAYIFAKSAIAAILSVSNIYFGVSSGYFQTTNELKPLLMTWSLGVEEQFYALTPLLMVLLARIRRDLLLPVILVVCTLSFLFARSYLKSYPTMAFYSLPARAWELGVGVALAVTELNWKRKLLSPRWSQAAGLIGLVLMMAPVYLLTSAMPFPGQAAVPSVVGTAMTVASPASWINRKLLSCSAVVFVGRISYSWYLWHWPMLSFLRIVSGGIVRPAVVALAIVASFVAAVISYYFVEQPFRRSARLPAVLLIRYAAISFLFLAAFSTLRLGHGFPKRYPSLSQDGDALSDPCVADYGTDKPHLLPRCYAASDPRPSVVLWGDSHSSVLAHTLHRASNEQGYNFIQMSKSSCLPLSGAAVFLPEHPLVARECIQFNKKVFDLIEADRRIRIVIMTGRWAAPFHEEDIYPLVSDSVRKSDAASTDYARSTFVRALSASIRPLQNSGRHVILLDDVPNFDFNPLMRYRTALIPARHAIAVWMGAESDYGGLAPAAFTSAADTSTEVFNEILKSIPGVELIELKSVFCDSHNLCAYMSGNRLLYSDEHHVTEDGAEYALRNFHFPKLQQ